MKKYQNKEWFVVNWLDTPKSLQTLAIEIGVHVTTLERWSKKFNLTKHNKYNINENKISINNPVFQYFLGLLYADGYVDSKAKRISLDLSYNIGKEILSKLKEYFNYTGDIGEYKNPLGKRIRYRLTIGNVFLYDLCICLGLTPNKTSKIRLPNLPKYNHFLRGFMDGDGHIKRKGKTITWYCHSKEFNEDVQHLLGFGTIYKHKLTGTTLGFQGENAIKFIKFIYIDTYYCLSNKLKIAKTKFEIREHATSTC